MDLTIPHYVSTKRSGITTVKVKPHHLDIAFGVAAHGVADHESMI